MALLLNANVSLLKKNQQFLSLTGALSNFSSEQKTVYLSHLVKELNENYAHVTYIDLTWNNLEPTNLVPLEELRHVTTLDLEWNKLDGSRSQDATVLGNVEKAVKDVSFYQGIPIQCR